MTDIVEIAVVSELVVMLLVVIERTLTFVHLVWSLFLRFQQFG